MIDVTLFESSSINGMIARSNGRGDFLTDVNWTSFVETVLAAGAMVWGRTTHEQARGWPRAIEALAPARGIVLTSRGTFEPEPGWTTAASPREAVERARSLGGRRLVVAGGKTVNTAFLRAGLVDEIVLNVEAVLIGRGVPVVADEELEVPLTLREIVRLTDSVVQLRYAVRSRAAGAA